MNDKELIIKNVLNILDKYDLTDDYSYECKKAREEIEKLIESVKEMSNLSTKQINFLKKYCLLSQEQINELSYDEGRILKMNRGGRMTKDLMFEKLESYFNMFCENIHNNKILPIDLCRKYLTKENGCVFYITAMVTSPKAATFYVKDTEFKQIRIQFEIDIRANNYRIISKCSTITQMKILKEVFKKYEVIK